VDKGGGTVIEIAGACVSVPSLCGGSSGMTTGTLLVNMMLSKVINRTKMESLLLGEINHRDVLNNHLHLHLDSVAGGKSLSPLAHPVPKNFENKFWMQGLMHLDRLHRDSEHREWYLEAVEFIDDLIYGAKPLVMTLSAEGSSGVSACMTIVNQQIYDILCSLLCKCGKEQMITSLPRVGTFLYLSLGAQPFALQFPQRFPSDDAFNVIQAMSRTLGPSTFVRENENHDEGQSPRASWPGLYRSHGRQKTCHSVIQRNFIKWLSCQLFLGGIRSVWLEALRELQKDERSKLFCDPLFFINENIGGKSDLWIKRAQEILGDNGITFIKQVSFSRSGHHSTPRDMIGFSMAGCVLFYGNNNKRTTPIWINSHVGNALGKTLNARLEARPGNIFCEDCDLRRSSSQPLGEPHKCDSPFCKFDEGYVHHCATNINICDATAPVYFCVFCKKDFNLK